MFGPLPLQVTMTPVDEQAAVLALVAASRRSRERVEWHRVAAIIESAGSAIRVVEQRWNGLEAFDHEEAARLAGAVEPGDLRLARELIDSMAKRRIGLITVLDESYPENLRSVFNRPPFLFVRGRLLPVDDRSVAVVGTRRASREGLEQARRLAQALAQEKVTVLSGLARGIDGAAHEASLDAGGRTLAVLGNGITRVYPSEHDQLANRIIDAGGALVSQFWPDAPPTRYSFPMRNAVMSGMAVGTVVVEASSTSGAKMQARLALEHGKRLFLVESLVLHESWAKRYAEHPATTVVESVDDILQVLTTLARPAEQLTLG